MAWHEVVLVLVVGFASGFINTLAGGGSLLSLPLLIFLGLPPLVANATNRVAIFFQNIFSVAGFSSKGVSTYPYSIYLGLSAAAGGIIGAIYAIKISGEAFNKILAIVMVGVIVYTLVAQKQQKASKAEKMSPLRQLFGTIIFFFIGIYGGFIQAGVGFLMIPALTLINGFSLVKTNSVKVFVALFFTFSSLIVFFLDGQINWGWGIILAVGNAAGGWIGSRWSVDKGDVWVKRFLLISVLALAVKLWFS